MPKQEKKQEKLLYNDVVKTLEAILDTIGYVKTHACDRPYHELQPLLIKKTMLSIDRAAQQKLTEDLKKIYSKTYKVQVWGEEDFEIREETSVDMGEFAPKKKSKKKKKIICLLDPIDGTDLFAKKLGNWCTAVVIYTTENKILASFIGLPNKTIYFSTNTMKGVAKKVVNLTDYISVNKKKSISSGITFSWYGQKVKNFLSVIKHKKFLKFIKKAKKDFRILNISGNPIMLQMVDNEVPVNVMVELCGQHPHDMVPGAYLATKAGAILTDLKGNKIKFEDYLSKPKKHRIKYILANSKVVYKKFFEIFKS